MKVVEILSNNGTIITLRTAATGDTFTGVVVASEGGRIIANCHDHARKKDLAFLIMVTGDEAPLAGEPPEGETFEGGGARFVVAHSRFGSGGREWVKDQPDAGDRADPATPD